MISTVMDNRTEETIKRRLLWVARERNEQHNTPYPKLEVIIHLEKNEVEIKSFDKASDEWLLM